MRTLLIVEDEKMIRQGIKAMAMRSGVPIEQIYECSNGIEALKILSEKHVDVMLTDIRMQKMDGIELVQRVNSMEDKPLIVAISGYDDFNYAVEMLRNGVKEYLLKPVEREKIAEILAKLDAELKQKNTGILDDEYQVCVYSEEPLSDNYDGIVLEEIKENTAIIIRKNRVADFLDNEMTDKCVGVSAVHVGQVELSTAYEEAKRMRELSFVQGKSCFYGIDQAGSVVENLKETARKLLTSAERTKRIQVIGTDKSDDVIMRWKGLFKALENGQIESSDFIGEIEESLKQIKQVYKAGLSVEDMEIAGKLGSIYAYENLTDYQTAFMDWLLDLNNRLGNRVDESNIRQKIVKAQKYIQDNYDSDLNMAVVSNYVSMNYSLFSYSFKQYTGSNFVNYLKEIRIEKAKALLAETDLKIIEISQMVGYENEKHFMKTFKNICGVSAGEYRRNMIN